ncbi:MAG: KpsF/GutQ family sugar-phosphate isomerase [Gammaproteobacteria bacterium]
MAGGTRPKPKSDAGLNPDKLKQVGRDVIEAEKRALEELASRIDDDFVKACHLIGECEGRVIVIGMGKSGHVGRKLAATLASTGTPAFFVHPGEASHGDMGMITDNDVVLALSNSGETEEIITLLPLIERRKIPLIALTGAPGSTLAREADVTIDVSVEGEAAQGLAPTTSTAAGLAMGDALAIALFEARGFSEKDFAEFHPGGALGRRLLRISDIMHQGNEMPTVTADTLLSDALIEMTQKGLGMTAILDGQGKVIGIFTDGDLRRTLDAKVDVHTARMGEVMIPEPKIIFADHLAAEALSMMEEHRINALPVVDDNDLLVGVLNMHDLLRARVV